MGLSSLFGPKLPIDGEELEFQLATFKWLLHEFGAPAQDGLVTPTPAFFPSDGRRGVDALFQEVRAAAGMGDWRCELRSTDEDEGEASGLFRVVEGPDGPCAIIIYDPEREHTTPAAVSSFAHQLAHYLMAHAVEAPPGGWNQDLGGLHADLAAVYLGFGIFLANSARQFQKWGEGRSGGWTAHIQGYLSEGAVVTALVIVERLCGRDPMAAAPHLKSYLESVLETATKALAKTHPDIHQAVEAIELTQFAGD